MMYRNTYLSLFVELSPFLIIFKCIIHIFVCSNLIFTLDLVYTCIIKLIFKEKYKIQKYENKIISVPNKIHYQGLTLPYEGWKSTGLPKKILGSADLSLVVQ